ncbi:MAG: sugar phosphate isomerase/epimerase [Actinomycetota bacterium]|nr:sugar phosphate isomerase/epimerase [Actinomycetota bacterium]
MNAPTVDAAATLDTSLEERIRSMRTGFQGLFYPAPADLDDEQKAHWLLTRSAELGATALQLFALPADRDARLRLAERARELDIELEGYAPAMFVPLGEDPETTTEELRAQLIAAREAGMTVVRSGYGRLTLETSKFARERNLQQQLDHVAACLRRAGRVAEEVGIPVAVENHCDFTGRELAGVLAEVGSEWVGCALDTANGFTVYCDPNDDVEALAEYTFTTHIKDMQMVQSPITWFIPMLPKGCKLGEGHVDIPRAVQLLAERSPRAERLHLLVEPGWESFGQPGERDPDELKKEIIEHGVAYLNSLIATSSR